MVEDCAFWCAGGAGGGGDEGASGDGFAGAHECGDVW